MTNKDQSNESMRGLFTRIWQDSRLRLNVTGGSKREMKDWRKIQERDGITTKDPWIRFLVNGITTTNNHGLARIKWPVTNCNDPTVPRRKFPVYRESIHKIPISRTSTFTCYCSAIRYDTCSLADNSCFNTKILTIILVIICKNSVEFWLLAIIFFSLKIPKFYFHFYYPLKLKRLLQRMTRGGAIFPGNVRIRWNMFWSC